MQQREKLSVRSAERPKTFLRLSLVFWYLWACLRHWVNPWNYFAINSQQFNPEKGIISKLDMDIQIPEPFRLKQFYYRSDTLPEHFPVFLKPEWGQNADGILRVAGENAYKKFQTTAVKRKIPYIVQEAAPGKEEFEIYYLRRPGNPDDAAFLSVTQVANACDRYHPINSIHNPCTRYKELTPKLSDRQLDLIWKNVKEIGDFQMARVGVKADNLQALTGSAFKIVEINLFLPMPLVLLADNVHWFEKHTIIRTTMTLAARLAKQVSGNHSGRQVFFTKLKKM